MPVRLTLLVIGAILAAAPAHAQELRPEVSGVTK